MRIISKVHRKLKKVYQKIICHDESLYISRISRKAPWVLVAYLPDVFYHQNDISYINAHQNKREALSMIPILNKLGYNVYVRHYEYSGEIPNYNFQIIFGHPPLIERAAEQFPKAKMVMYATGCLYTHQNKQEIEITNAINKRYGFSIPYVRLVKPYNCHITSNKILLIGSKYTIETFPANTHSKITTIHQSSQTIRTLTPIIYSNENDFLFIGSCGNLLKGVSFIVDYFSTHPTKTIHIIGPIEDYLESIRETLPPNIILHGWLDINSDKYLSIISKCNFIIYPSGSEGAPGSVINAMYNGIIPIVTRWSAFDEISDYGFLMEGWDVKSIANGVNWSDSLDRDEVLYRKRKCAEFAKHTYNLATFSEEFEKFFRNIS